MPHRHVDTTRPALTKILATLGPASSDPAVVAKLVESGATLFRLNFSHGSEADHAQHLSNVREVSRVLRTPLAVLGDLCGPKIRVSKVPPPGVEVRAGEDFLFRAGVETAIVGGPEPVFGCTYERLIDEVKPGQRVLINDGAIRALATEPEDGDEPGTLRCRVIHGGLVTSGKGVNLPDTHLSAPAITPTDWRWVEWSVENGVDLLALSFVRRGEDVRQLRKGLERLCEGRAASGVAGDTEEPSSIPIIAKIEKPQAVDRIDEILAEADGIMVARGDLGVEMDLACVPVIQKSLIARAQHHGKPCIVATQMLETMIERPIPTRAEASDVANAIFDHADAVMLSAETAAGKHPALVVETMKRIALVTEARLRELPAVATPPARAHQMRHRTVALAHGAWHIANDIGAKLVAIWSESGGSARYLSRMGIRVPILAFSSSETAIRRMALLYGVTPILINERPEHRSDFALIVDRVVLKRRLAEPGEPMIVMAGKPLGKPGVVNTLSVRVIGELAGRID